MNTTLNSLYSRHINKIVKFVIAELAITNLTIYKQKYPCIQWDLSVCCTRICILIELDRIWEQGKIK